MIACSLSSFLFLVMLLNLMNEKMQFYVMLGGRPVHVNYEIESFFCYGKEEVEEQFEYVCGVIEKMSAVFSKINN